MKGFILAVMLLNTSCICLQPAHRNDLQCVVLHGVVDCTEATVQALIPQFKPLVQQLIAEATTGGKINWAAVEKGLSTLGIKDGGCILADLEKDFLEPTPPTAALDVYAARISYLSNFDTYRSKKWPRVKFRVLKVNGTTVDL